MTDRTLADTYWPALRRALAHEQTKRRYCPDCGITFAEVIELIDAVEPAVAAAKVVLDAHQRMFSDVILYGKRMATRWPEGEAYAKSRLAEGRPFETFSILTPMEMLVKRLARMG